jgi:hypothetical protein
MANRFEAIRKADTLAMLEIISARYQAQAEQYQAFEE